MKKFFLYTGITVAILLLLYFGLSFWLVRSTYARVEARRQAIADAGDAVYLTEYESEEIPDEENAYYYLMLAAPDLEAFETDWETVADLELERQLTPEQVDALAKIIEKYPQMFEQLEKASACDKYRPNVDYAQGLAMEMPHVMHFRSVARAQSAKALVAAYDGDGDTALGHCKTSLRLSSHLREEPTLISHLVHIASQSISVLTINHSLRVADTSPATRAELAELLAQFDNRQATVDAMKGERATGITTFQQIRDGTLSLEDLGTPNIGIVGNTWLGQAYLNDDEAKYIELLDKQIETAKLSKPERDKAMQPLIDDLEQSGFRHMFSRLLVPALNAAVDATGRHDALVRSIRILLVIHDKDDITIDDIDLPDAAKADPFTGDPLTIENREEGWVIYSVGENLRDDGGEIYNANGKSLDNGIGPLLPILELPDVVEP